MVELRSGTNTGGQEPRTSEGRDPNIPEDIEVTNQGDQMPNQGVQMMDPINQQGQPAEDAAQGVYVGGTSAVSLAGQSAVAGPVPKLPLRAEKLVNPNLIQLWNSVSALPRPVMQSHRKYHNRFKKQYKELLLYYQARGTSVVDEVEDKELYAWVKNQYTNLRRAEQNNEGPLAKNPTYKIYLAYLGIKRD